MTDFERTAYRNEIDFLRKRIDYLERLVKELVTMIFKLKSKDK